MPWPSERAEKIGVVLVLAAVLAVTTAWKLPFAREGKMIGDAPIYLDIARQMKEGRGALLGINFYQDWTGPTVAGVPYHHIGYALWVRAVWTLRDSVAAVSVANVALAVLALLLYYALCRRFFSRAVSLVSGVLLGFSWPLFTASILPLAEQLQFVLLLLGLLLLWHPRAPQWAGALAAVVLSAALLVRVAHLYSCAALLLSERRKLFYLAVVLTLGGWEIFCWTRYGKLYPQYPEPARVLSVATWFPGGYYAREEPHLRLPPMGMGFRLRQTIRRTPVHLGRFLGQLVNNSGWALAALPIFLPGWRRRLRGLSLGSRLFLAQALAPMLGYAFTFYWLERVEARYALLPLAFLLPPLFEALLGLRWMADRRLAGALLALTMGVAGLRCCWFIQGEPAQPWRLSGIQMPRAEAYAYVRGHSLPGNLVASNEIGYLYELERPAVSLPRGQLLNEKNLEDYLRIFRPQWIVIDRQALDPAEIWNPIYNPVLERAGFRLVYSNFGYWIFSRAPQPAASSGPPS